MARTLVLIAGPSGSGKSRITKLAADGEHSVALSLDDFYRDLDHPDLPMTPMGIPDWDDISCWDKELAVTTLATLLRDGRAEVPVYDISLSMRTGSRVIDIGSAQVVLAEGIFAIQTLAAAREAGLAVEALWLHRSRNANFVRRLIRDLKEHRKPPLVLLQRGWALYRDEPHLRRAALAAGFRGISMRQALRNVQKAALLVDQK